MSRIVQLHAVGVRLGGVPVLHDVELAIEPGEVLGVVGPNGSGKTTLLRVMATLAAPSAGSGTVFDAPLGTAAVRAIRPRIGLAGHRLALWPELTLRENLVAVARLSGYPDEEADQALEAAGLRRAGGRQARVCSNGMQRRVDLARLLMTRAELVLLDEPAAGLDRDATALISAVVDAAIGRQGAAVVVSHDEAHLGAVATRLVSMFEGAIAPVERSRR